MVFPALAQTTTGNAAAGKGTRQTLKTVQVLGSRIKSSTLATTTPTMRVSGQDIRATGLTSIGDVLQQLPISGSALNGHQNLAGNFGAAPDGSGVGAGSITLSLRNLDPNRTLVLVDGLPWVNESSGSGVSGAVDLGTIPMSAIQSVQILPDGASALYGSDAIAGVVNIITKQSQQGGSAQVYYGIHDIDGTHTGQTRRGSLSFGGSGNKYRFFVTFDHTRENPISSAVWPTSSGCIPGTGTANCTTDTPFGRFAFTAPGNTTFGGLCPGGVCVITPKQAVANPGQVQPFPGGFRRFSANDRYVYGPWELLQLFTKRNGFMGSVSYDLTPDVQFYFRGTYSNRRSTNRDAPEDITYGPSGSSPGDPAFTAGIDASNPYNPFGFSLNPDNSDPNFGIFLRPISPGPRYFTQNVSTRYLASGLKGSFGIGEHNFNWDFNVAHASNNATQHGTNQVNDTNLVNALGPVAVCKTLPGCVPFDAFGGPGSRTAQMFDYIYYRSLSQSHQQLGLISANLSGDVVKLPADWLRFAVGYQHRNLSGSFSPDPLVAAGIAGTRVGPTAGKYSVNSFYTEFNVPILANLPGVRALNLDIASRYSNYSTFGGTTNSRAALRWQPVDDLTLRASWGQGFRAPSIGELFGSRNFFNGVLVDPCDFDSPLAGPQVVANCRALGVANPATFEQPNIQIETATGGNANLKPERSRSEEIGFVYSPSWAANTPWAQAVDVKFTNYHISVKNLISATSAQTLMNRCAQTLDPAFCGLVQRNGAGVITLVTDSLQNLGRVDTSGFDFSIDWVGQPSRAGDFSANFQSTYVNNFRIVNGLTGLPEPQTVGVEESTSAIPRWKAQVRINWHLHDWSAAWTTRYISRLTEDCESAAGFPICTDPTPTAQFVDGHRSLGSTVYNDVRVNWAWPGTVFTFSGGLNNIFDRDPPTCVSCSLNGYDATTYDLPGRFWYVSADVKF